MERFTTITAAIAMLLAVIYFSVDLGRQLQLNEMREAYTICSDSREYLNGTTPKACADAQVRTSTEFICNNSGQYCWLEVNY